VTRFVGRDEGLEVDDEGVAVQDVDACEGVGRAVERRVWDHEVGEGLGGAVGGTGGGRRAGEDGGEGRAGEDIRHGAEEEVLHQLAKRDRTKGKRHRRGPSLLYTQAQNTQPEEQMRRLGKGIELARESAHFLGVWVRSIDLAKRALHSATGR
jgi:hypothetical protein